MFREFPFMDRTHGVYCRHRSVQMNYQGTERKRGNVSSPEEKNTGGGGLRSSYCAERTTVVSVCASPPR